MSCSHAAEHASVHVDTCGTFTSRVGVYGRVLMGLCRLATQGMLGVCLAWELVVYVCRSEHVLIPLGRAGARTTPPQHVRERQGQAVCASPSLTRRVTSGRSSGPQPPPPETGMIIAVTSTVLPGPTRSKSIAQRMHFRNVSCYHHAGVGRMVPCLPWGPRTLRRGARTKVSLCLALPCAFPGGRRSLAHSNQRAVLEL